MDKRSQSSQGSRKSRQIGFSWCEAADCALTASANNGMDAWIVSTNEDAAREFINDVASGKAYQPAAENVEELAIKEEVLSFRVTLPVVIE